MHQSWGYLKNNVKGRNLAQDATELDYILITDPAYPTRIGNSISRDTTPDLTFVKNDADAVIKWRNTGDDLGSDHVIVEITVPVPGDQKNNVKKYTWIDWSEFRKIRNREEADVEEIDDIDEWTDKIARNVREATKEIETDVETEAMDSRLAHLIEAKKAIQDRWKKQRLNRRLRKKVAELNKEIENHCRVLSNQKWNEMCCAVDGQLHNGKAWNLLKHLMDETKTKSHQRDRLAKLLHREVTENGAEAVTQKLRDRYVPTTPTVVHDPYRGRSNERLDRDIEVEEVRTALHYLNTRSAPGPDRITNKILRNLDDKSIENLTAYYNKCWRSAMEHVLHNRWQEYLEGEELYPETIIGFRQHLSTQDAMIQIRHQIIDDKTRDNKAILGLDLESAFDKVTHAAVLRQVSELNMGERSYQYIKDFLTGRTAELRAGELQADEKELGSQGTPQGAVISPMLFNLVMIRVAKRLIQIKDLCHTIYADDITLWVNGGSDAHIEATLQRAVEAIEESLEGSGLRRSPSKSELLIYQPTKAHRTKNRESEKIKIRTGDGNEIPTVNMIRILVLHKVYPDAYPDDKCKVCRDERATMEHILWDCKKHPDEARRRIFPPSLEWATRTEDQETQLKAIQRVIEALARQGLGEPEKASRDTCRRAKKTT
ncbi:uncharacterized protein LOC144142925 [Haemaphysalis longicornis]